MTLSPRRLRRTYSSRISQSYAACAPPRLHLRDLISEIAPPSPDKKEGVSCAHHGAISPQVRDLCKPEPEKEGGGGKQKAQSSFASVGDKFVKSLRDLMTELQSSQAWFVRCIKSNPQLKPKLMNGEVSTPDWALSASDYL